MKMKIPLVFNASSKLIQKNRSVIRDLELNKQVDYLKDEIAARLVDRFYDIKRRFVNVLDLGAGCGHIAKHLESELVSGKLVQFEESQEMLFRDSQISRPVNIERVQGSLDKLPFDNDTFDAVVSNLSIHWVNDLPGTLIQAKNVLKPDGVFIGALFGGDTLFELRTAFQLAEQERDGGISPHVSPMVLHQEMGSLLSRAGFTLTTVDVDEITINYPSMFELIEDLQAMGESNALLMRKPNASKDLFLAANEIYKAVYGKKSEKDGKMYIPASFQVIFLIGWKAHPSQPQPLKRGTAKHSFKDLGSSSNGSEMAEVKKVTQL